VGGGLDGAGRWKPQERRHHHEHRNQSVSIIRPTNTQGIGHTTPLPPHHHHHSHQKTPPNTLSISLPRPYTDQVTAHTIVHTTPLLSTPRHTTHGNVTPRIPPCGVRHRRTRSIITALSPQKYTAIVGHRVRRYIGMAFGSMVVIQVAGHHHHRYSRRQVISRHIALHCALLAALRRHVEYNMPTIAFITQPLGHCHFSHAAACPVLLWSLWHVTRQMAHWVAPVRHAQPGVPQVVATLTQSATTTTHGQVVHYRVITPSRYYGSGITTTFTGHTARWQQR